MTDSHAPEKRVRRALLRGVLGSLLGALLGSVVAGAFDAAPWWIAVGAAAGFVVGLLLDLAGLALFTDSLW